MTPCLDVAPPPPLLLVQVLHVPGLQVVSELLPAGDYWLAEQYHQQYLSKGGRFGSGQSAEKNCKDKIRCYG